MSNMFQEIYDYTTARNNVIIAAVVNDDWESVYAFVKWCGMSIPTNERVMKAGVYKAVQEVISIPQEVKDVAREKCITLGFKPTMWEG